MRAMHKLGQLTPAQVLRAEGIITSEQGGEIEQEIQTSHERFIDVVLARSLATEFEIAKAMVRHLHLPMLPPSSYPVADAARTVLPTNLLHDLSIVPYDCFGDLVLVATTGDLLPHEIADIESQGKGKASFVVALKSEIERTLEKEFPMETLGQEVASRLDELFGS